MTVARCQRCGAVAPVRRGANGAETTYGNSFRDKGKWLSGRAAADFVSTVTECPDMGAAGRKSSFRRLPRAASAFASSAAEDGV